MKPSVVVLTGIAVANNESNPCTRVVGSSVDPRRGWFCGGCPWLCTRSDIYEAPLVTLLG